WPRPTCSTSPRRRGSTSNGPPTGATADRARPRAAHTSPASLRLPDAICQRYPNGIPQGLYLRRYVLFSTLQTVPCFSRQVRTLQNTACTEFDHGASIGPLHVAMGTMVSLSDLNIDINAVSAALHHSNHLTHGTRDAGGGQGGAIDWSPASRSPAGSIYAPKSYQRSLSTEQDQFEAPYRSEFKLSR
ncbi:MAG: hypothetical protein QOF73_4688, partial [Thermomicrobiales bacterium]|nr:hypothetical protein [Thermomicrobiales bacterium]